MSDDVKHDTPAPPIELDDEGTLVQGDEVYGSGS